MEIKPSLFIHTFLWQEVNKSNEWREEIYTYTLYVCLCVCVRKHACVFKPDVLSRLYTAGRFTLSRNVMLFLTCWEEMEKFSNYPLCVCSCLVGVCSLSTCLAGLVEFLIALHCLCLCVLFADVDINKWFKCVALFVCVCVCVFAPVHVFGRFILTAANHSSLCWAYQHHYQQAWNHSFPLFPNRSSRALLLSFLPHQKQSPKLNV